MSLRGESIHKDVCCIADLKELGKQTALSHGPSLRENEAAFDRYKIRPRILANVEKIDTSTEVLDPEVNLSFGFSLAASHKLAHPDGELATSRAAAKFGICMGSSSYATYPVEEVAAQGAGYKALFLSVDAPVLGKRLNEYRNEFRIPEDMEYPDILSSGTDVLDRTDYGNIALLKFCGSRLTPLDPICSPEDVELAIRYKIDGIVVSNHGGRQLDGVPSTLDALRVCAPIANGRIPITIDGGIRRGSDVFKALALGASYCFLGRIPIWSLAVLFFFPCLFWAPADFA
ncbi:FMN-dependent dehydrogenase family protein [Penicillium maclennaniae]|uniref:FMN-dependent dehydrogenase family protein n=1 Tax=Penicillium maclennaniae TaxID=1343394 RepID=UPI002540D3AE|nr:FMN-dependent dehydrogenase family protein [Penicillium maclennaniae]KAJ5666116.1 FMN-dependent dehydrogenase family protein [Penicillium maclennaniae]